MVLLDRIVTRKHADAQAAVWFPRQTVDANNVQYVMWRTLDGWNTGTIMDWFEYRGAVYIHVAPHTGNISLKALEWEAVSYVL